MYSDSSSALVKVRKNSMILAVSKIFIFLLNLMCMNLMIFSRRLRRLHSRHVQTRLFSDAIRIHYIYIIFVAYCQSALATTQLLRYDVSVR